jgi:hypothetical protein
MRPDEARTAGRKLRRKLNPSNTLTALASRIAGLEHRTLSIMP